MIFNFISQSLIKRLNGQTSLLGGLYQFDAFLTSKSGEGVKYICIFCAGKWGIKLYHELGNVGISPDFFCDNDLKKTGNMVETLKCISLNELVQKKMQTLVIVSTVHPEAIIRQLTSLEFPFLITRQEVLPFLNSIFPIEKLESFLLMDKINYADYQTEIIIQKFREIIINIHEIDNVERRP